MKFKWKPLIVILVSLVVWNVSADSPEYITIGTFNIQCFGETVNPARVANLAKICRDVDLLAIQEVHPDGADAVAELAEAMGVGYRWAVSDVTTWERFAFIWRHPVTLQNGPYLLDVPKLGRRPFFAAFQAGNFQFEIVNMHLFFDGSKKTYPHHRSVEFKLLDDWLCYREDQMLSLVLVGDFNAPGLFYGTQFPPPLSAAYFFYEFLCRHNLISVTLDAGVPTSIMNNNIYDHIIFNPSKYFVPEFAGQELVEIVCWERDWISKKQDVLDWDSYQKARKAISDHRLVKAKFRMDLPAKRVVEDEKPDDESTKSN
ncbi:MAG: endonuclease/exonuclease/phosphatase family protein [bacterium]